MSRPKNPDWTVEPFAPDANYPVGALPWSGTPTKVPWAGAPSVGFSPKGGVPAQCINHLFNATFDLHGKVKASLTEIVNHTGQGAALNPIGDSGAAFASAARAAFFVPRSQTWWVVGDAALNTATQDLGVSWHTPIPVPFDDTAQILGGDSDDNGVVVLCTNKAEVWVVDDFSYGNPLTGDYNCFGSLPGDLVPGHSGFDRLRA